MSAQPTVVVDLFAGPGGWSVAVRSLAEQLEATLLEVGIEWDASACETRRAAAFPTIEGDVRKYGPADFLSLLEEGWAYGLIASPPCQTFSTAGKGAGRKALDVVLAAISAMTVAYFTGTEFVHPEWSDERTSLVLEPLRWVLEALATRPFEWVALEQVPAVLPVWEAMAEVLQACGYSVATGVVTAEQYGVPQTRRRAVLVARLDPDGEHEPLTLPKPTHSKFYSRDRTKLDEGVLPWVSMAEALGWGMTERPYLTVAPGTGGGGTDPQAVGGSGARRSIDAERQAGRWEEQPDPADPRWTRMSKAMGAGMVERYGDRPDRLITEPSFTMTGRTTRTPVYLDEIMAGEIEPVPRVNDQSGTPYDPEWPAQRPAQTIATRDLVPNPGATRNATNGSTKSRNDGVRVTVAEAACLQSFPADHPWQGTKSKQYEQVGNAIPPLLAEAVLRQVIR